MAKPRKGLRVRLPPYVHPRLVWRRKLQDAIEEKQRQVRVTYEASDRLELSVLLYLKGRALEIHDVDNRLKDVMDALQGRIGGSKARKPVSPIILNDRQIWRVVIEKREPPPQSHGLGHLTIRRLRR